MRLSEGYGRSALSPVLVRTVLLLMTASPPSFAGGPSPYTDCQAATGNAPFLLQSVQDLDFGTVLIDPVLSGTITVTEKSAVSVTGGVTQMPTSTVVAGHIVQGGFVQNPVGTDLNCGNYDSQVTFGVTNPTSPAPGITLTGITWSSKTTGARTPKYNSGDIYWGGTLNIPGGQTGSATPYIFNVQVTQTFP